MKADKSKLTLAMAQRCWNPQDLAKAAEMPPQTVRRVLLERGVRPATLGHIAKALGVDPAELIEED